MSKLLPDFDELLLLAQSDPKKLETLRQEMCEELINSAPHEKQRRLRGLQFQIDMEREKSTSPMGACIRISQMMHESFDELRVHLNQLSETQSQVKATRINTNSGASGIPAKVINFPGD